MNRLKQGMAAVVLVMSLGMVMPSAFGGSGLADPEYNGHNAVETPRTFYCEIGGETVRYEVVSQGNGFAGFEALDSTTVFEVVWDQKFLTYTAPDGSSFTEALAPRYTNRGQKLGQNAQTVPCHEYKRFDDPVVRDGVAYQVEQDRVWHVTVSGDHQGAVKAATVDGGKHHKTGHHKGHKGKHGR
jgi:hypothetical protein